MVDRIEYPETDKIIAVKKMEVGQIGEVPGGEPNAHVILIRTYDGLVDLRNPGATWSLPGIGRGPQFKVRLFPKGTKVTLVVEK